MRDVKQRDLLAISGGFIPIELYCNHENGRDLWGVDIDGVNWFELKNQTHAIVLYHMMKEHITQYMHYEKL